MAEFGEMPLEPAVEPDFGILGRHGQGLDAGHAPHPSGAGALNPSWCDELAAPMSAVPHIAAAHEDPFARDPDGLGPRGVDVMTGDPDVAAAIPAPKAG